MISFIGARCGDPLKRAKAEDADDDLNRGGSNQEEGQEEKGIEKRRGEEDREKIREKGVEEVERGARGNRARERGETRKGTSQKKW